MSDQDCPVIAEPLDVTNHDASSSNDDDGVALRRDGNSLRRIREHNKSRTPTTVVSDAFTFLNEHGISIVDAVEQGSLSTEEQFGDGGVLSKGIVFSSSETETQTAELDSYDNHLPQIDCFLSKDSGFASLERHIHCDDTLSFEANQENKMNCDNVSQAKNYTETGINYLPESEHHRLADGVNVVGHDDPLISGGGAENSVQRGSFSSSTPCDKEHELLNRPNGLKVKEIELVKEVKNNECENSLEQLSDFTGTRTEDGRISISAQSFYSAECSELTQENSTCGSSIDIIHNTTAGGEGCDLTHLGAQNENYVDMRKKADVIPASPIKHTSSSSKSGLLLEANPVTEVVSDDSSDEDTGIYAESFRRSNWIRVSEDKKRTTRQQVSSNNSPTPVPQSTKQLNPPPLSLSSGRGSVGTQLGVGEEDSNNGAADIADDVFPDPMRSLMNQKLCHKRSDSVTTTDSENDFKTRYISRRKCLIQRADSQQEYHRLSARIYEEDKEVILERSSESEDLGLHILDSHPTYITSVDPGSPAEKAGIVEGQILVTVNDLNVLLTDHDDIIKLIQDCKGPLKLGVASTDFQPIRDLQAPVISGHMYKLGTSSLVRIWKKRFFVLRNDNCLYYYKSDQDLDPLGALPLAGYTISRHTDTSKDFCFKAEKYRARTYYFMTENRDQLTQWVAILTEAALRSKKQKESSSFMSVSSHNVSLPALDIRKPECSGYLVKLSPHSRSWRRRYCLLKDACIYYYKDVNSFSALGVAHLHGYTVDVAGQGKKKNSFSLKPPDVKMRQFVFAADNETDKKRWVEAIIHSIQRWVPVET